MRRRLGALLAGLFLLAACSGGGGEGGTAKLWVTRGGSSQVLHQVEVPAGVTVLQALEREAEVDTRYGGRFVKTIDGLEGSLARGRDWFYFVNGYEADRGAAEYRLRDGDVAWWDFRAWRGRREQPVVVGAFPEPFLHGYGGKTRPAAVRYDDPSLEQEARALAKLVGAVSVAPSSSPVPEGANLLRLARGAARFDARIRDGTGAGAPVEFVLGGDDASRLARDPSLVRFRYSGLPA